MKNFIWKLYVRFCYAKWAVKKINKLKIGDIVHYNGFEYIAYQGVSDPYWKITSTKESPFLTTLVAHKKDLIMQPLCKRFWFSFKSTYDFHMSYWFQINVRSKSITLI